MSSDSPPDHALHPFKERRICCGAPGRATYGAVIRQFVARGASKGHSRSSEYSVLMTGSKDANRRTTVCSWNFTTSTRSRSTLDAFSEALQTF